MYGLNRSGGSRNGQGGLIIAHFDAVGKAYAGDNFSEVLEAVEFSRMTGSMMIQMAELSCGVAGRICMQEIVTHGAETVAVKLWPPAQKRSD